MDFSICFLLSRSQAAEWYSGKIVSPCWLYPWPNCDFWPQLDPQRLLTNPFLHIPSWFLFQFPTASVAFSCYTSLVPQFSPLYPQLPSADNVVTYFPEKIEPIGYRVFSFPQKCLFPWLLYLHSFCIVFSKANPSFCISLDASLQILCSINLSFLSRIFSTFSSKSSFSSVYRHT